MWNVRGAVALAELALWARDAGRACAIVDEAFAALAGDEYVLYSGPLYSLGAWAQVDRALRARALRDAARKPARARRRTGCAPGSTAGWARGSARAGRVPGTGARRARSPRRGARRRAVGGGRRALARARVPLPRGRVRLARGRGAARRRWRARDRGGASGGRPARRRGARGAAARRVDRRARAARADPSRPEA